MMVASVRRDRERAAVGLLALARRSAYALEMRGSRSRLRVASLRKVDVLLDERDVELPPLSAARSVPRPPAFGSTNMGVVWSFWSGVVRAPTCDGHGGAAGGSE